MNIKEFSNEIVVVIICAIILGVSVSMFNLPLIPISILFLLIIVAVNITVKKLIAYCYQADIKTKFWKLTRLGFKRTAAFKTPIIMLWLPLLISLITMANFFWLAITSSEITPKIERAARKHKFFEVTELQTSFILSSGVIANIVLAVIVYAISLLFTTQTPALLQTFIKLNLYYGLWSLIPIGALDGTKILIGNRKVWIAAAAITFLATIVFLLLFNI